MAPPPPLPPLPPFWAGPPSAPLPPRARLSAKVLCDTVAWLPPRLEMAPPQGRAAGAGAGVGTGRLVAGKRAVGDGQGRAGVVGDAAARGLASAGSLVAGERAVIDGQGRAEDIGDGAAGGVETDDLVVGQGHVGDDQVAAVIEDAAAQGDGA